MRIKNKAAPIIGSSSNHNTLFGDSIDNSTIIKNDAQIDEYSMLLELGERYKLLGNTASSVRCFDKAEQMRSA